MHWGGKAVTANYEEIVLGWNNYNLSNAVAGKQGLTLATNSADTIGIGVSRPTQKLEVSGNAIIGETGETLKIGNIGLQSWAGIAHSSRANREDFALILI